MKNIIERVIMLYGYPADTPQKTAIWQNLKWLEDIFIVQIKGFVTKSRPCSDAVFAKLYTEFFLAVMCDHDFTFFIHYYHIFHAFLISISLTSFDSVVNV